MGVLAFAYSWVSLERDDRVWSRRWFKEEEEKATFVSLNFFGSY